MELIILLVVLYLLFGRKKKKQKAKQTPSVRKKTVKTNVSGERMDRLTRKGELPWGWYTENREFIARIESEHGYFVNAYDKSRRKGIKQEYAALKSLILHMEDVQKLCKRKGECFAFWSTFVVANPQDIADYKIDLKKLEAKLNNAKK